MLRRFTKGVTTVQQKMPSTGRLFPDQPQTQQAPRFPSNNGAQGYEPQARMQQTGSIPVINAPVRSATTPLFTTGTMQALRGTQPVQTMQPMSTMPPASAFQSPQSMPVLIQTLQGTPVLVTREALEAAVAQLPKLPDSPADSLPDPAEKGRKGRKAKQPKKPKEKKEKKKRFSFVWFGFGLIGVATVLVSLARYVVIPLLAHYF